MCTLPVYQWYLKCILHLKEWYIFAGILFLFFVKIQGRMLFGYANNKAREGSNTKWFSCWNCFGKVCDRIKTGSDAHPYEEWYISFDATVISPKVSMLFYPVAIETLAVIHWNSYVAPNCKISWYISALQNHNSNKRRQQICKTPRFYS